jgi:nitroreductase
MDDPATRGRTGNDSLPALPATPPDEPAPSSEASSAWPRLDRRRFLILTGGAAAAAASSGLASALLPAEALAARERRPTVPQQFWELASTTSAEELQSMRPLIAAAVLAPSACNSQPWRFEVEGPVIRLLADPVRALPARDPERRELMVSVGAALENLLIAARHYGLRPIVSYFPHDGARGVAAEIQLENGDLGSDAGLFQFIAGRRTNRRNYEGRGITGDQRGLLAAQVGDESFALLWIEEEKRRRALAALAAEAVRETATDRRMADEYWRWLRFSDEDERVTGDGLPMDALRIGGLTRWFARRNFDPARKQLRTGAGALADQAREGIRSAAAVALLVSKTRGEQQRLVGGQIFERIALKATQLGLAHQPLNAMVQLDRYRSDLRQAFGFGDEDPIVMFRVGYAKPVDPTPRRAVTVVASWRTS